MDLTWERGPLKNAWGGRLLYQRAWWRRSSSNTVTERHAHLGT